MQVCKHQIPMHYSTFHSEMHSLLFCAVQCSLVPCTRDQCTAALFRATCKPFYSVLLCKQAGRGLVPLYYNPEDTLFIQLCQHLGPMHCRAVWGNVQYFCSVLAQQHNSSGLVPVHLQLKTSTLRAAVSPPDTNALQHCSGQNACLFGMCCCASKAGSGFVQSFCTYQSLLFAQVCNHQTPMHCSRVQLKMHTLMLGALQRVQCVQGALHTLLFCDAMQPKVDSRLVSVQ